MPGGAHPPPSVIFTWSPNYVNPEKRGWMFPAIIIAVYLPTLIAVFFRLLARFVYLRNAGLDDLFIIIAVVGILVTTSSIYPNATQVCTYRLYSPFDWR
jgi:hypothetical protein